MAQVQLHRNVAPLKLDGAATQLELSGIIVQLETDKWIRNHDAAQLKRLGHFAVEEKNRKAKWHLKFKRAYEGWFQPLTGGRGFIHLVHLEGEHEDVVTNYEAYVWEKCDRCLELRSLSPIVQENLGKEPYA